MPDRAVTTGVTIQPGANGVMPELVLGTQFVRLHPNYVKGQVIAGHRHAFDHLTIFRSGVWLAEQLDDDGRVVRSATFGDRADNWFCLIRAGVRHRFTCVEDGSMVCTYSHLTPQGTVSLAYTGWEHAYAAVSPALVVEER